MRLLRSCLAGAFFAAFALGSLLLGFLLFPILLACGGDSGARRRMRTLVRASYRLFVSAARVTGLLRVDVSPEDLIDIVVLIAHLGDATAVAKSAAARNPFYARVVRSAFLVNDDPAGVLAEAGELLRQGVNIVVFPEGTRTPAGFAGRRLRRGAAQIALAANAPVLPVRIVCSPPVLAKGQPWHDVGGRTVSYSLKVGEAIPAATAAVPRHAAAVALTRRIGQTLFGEGAVAT